MDDQNQAPDLASAGRPTLADVARLARVAPITVSRTLRRPDLVAESTRTRIEAAIQALGYIPDLVAGSLASRRTGLIAAVLPSVTNPAFATTIQGIFDGLLPRGFQVVLGDNGGSAEGEEAIVTAFLGRRVDGLILTGVQHGERTCALLARAGLPVAEIWNLSSAPIDLNVGFDNHGAAAAMTTALVAAGRRRIGMICGPQRFNERSSDRRRGFQDAMAAAGLAGDLVVELPYPGTSDAAAAAMAELVERRPDLDAVFCGADRFAAAALFECQRRGWPVPGRIALAGLGDLELAGHLVPALTTARVPGHRMGSLAGTLLADRLLGTPTGAQIRDVGFEIIRRGSA